MRLSVKAEAFILCPLLIGLISISDTFVYVVLTDKWCGTIVYIQILSLLYLFRPLNTVFQKGLLAIGDSAVNLFHEVITSVLTIILMVICVFVFDSILLIAWSYVFITVIGTSIFASFTKKRFGYKFNEMLKDYVPYVLRSIIMGALVFGVGKLFSTRSITQLSVQIFVGIVAYILISWITKCEMFFFALNIIRRKS